MAVLGISTNPGNAQALRETQLAAAAFSVQIQYLDVQDPKDIETSFRVASKVRADALLVLGVHCRFSASTVAEIAVKSRLPATYNGTELWKTAGS